MKLRYVIEIGAWYCDKLYGQPWIKIQDDQVSKAWWQKSYQFIFHRNLFAVQFCSKMTKSDLDASIQSLNCLWNHIPSFHRLRDSCHFKNLLFLVWLLKMVTIFSALALFLLTNLFHLEHQRKKQKKQ